MLTGFLHLHNVLRYLIIIVAIIAIVRLIKGKSSNKPYDKSIKTPSLLFMIFMDVQLLLGIALFFFQKYTVKLSEIAFSEWDKVSKFFVREHIPLMIIALILVHIGYAKLKKTDVSDQKKMGTAANLFIVAIVIILASIPWPFRDLGRGWIPGMQ